MRAAAGQVEQLVYLGYNVGYDPRCASRYAQQLVRYVVHYQGYNVGYYLGHNVGYDPRHDLEITYPGMEECASF